MDPVRRRFVERAQHERQRFLAALKNARAEQSSLFQRYVASSADTAFGRDHGFAEIRTLDDYRRAVPIRTYDELTPWIDRVVAGERGVLTSTEPTLFLTTTGTTGRPKLVPATRDYFNLSVRNLLAWWGNTLDQYPELMDRTDTVVMLHLAPKPYSEFTPRGIPIHVNTCLPPVSDGGFPYSGAPWYPPPSEMTDAERLYFLLRTSVESDVIGFACLHSSRLQATTLRLQQSAPTLIQELSDGTVCGKAARAPNPERARELELLVAAGPLLPRHVWPSLKFTACWTGGTLRLYLPEIQSSFGGALVPQMSSSSEVAQMTMAVDREPFDGPLTVQTNFYEFLPVGERAGTGSETLTLQDLELGATYEMVVTTCAGLYRYNCGDQFRVLGFFDGVPRVEFVGRSGVSDLTGEKITEQHVAAAIEAALASSGLRAANATCCPVWANPSYYTFVIELAGPPGTGPTQELCQRLDDELMKQAPRYRLKRGWGDLGPTVLKLVRAGTFARYRERLIDDGAPGTQIKDRVLYRDAAVLAELDAADSHPSAR